jgi:hypothetical protein
MSEAWKQIVLLVSDRLIAWGMQMSYNHRSDAEITAFAHMIRVMRQEAAIERLVKDERITKS